jgi:TP901 family phage tail tape measure protein
MASLGELLVRVGADISQFQSSMGSVTKELDKIGKNFDNMSSRLASAGTTLTAGITAPIAAIGGVSLKAQADFEVAMNGVQAVSDLTAAELEQVKQKALEMGQKTQFSATQSALAMKELLASGLDVNAVFAAIGPTTNLAVAGEMALNDASALLVSTLSQFGLTANDAAHATDVLVMAANAGVTSVPELGESLKMAGGAAHMAGLSLEETAAALSIMSNNGLKGTQAGTSLTAAIREMLNPSKQQAELMNQLGLTFTDASGKMLPLADIIQQLKDKNISASEAIKLFGVEGARAIIALQGGLPEFQKLTTELNNSGGAAEKAANLMGTGINAELTKLKNQVESALIPLGQALVPAFQSLAGVLQTAIQWLTQAVNWFTSLPQPVQNAAIGIAAFAAAIGPAMLALSGFASAMSSMLSLPGTLTAALGALKTTFISFGPSISGAVTALGGFSTIIGVAAAAVGAFMLAKWAYDNFEPFRQAVDSVGAFLKDVFLFVLEGVKLAFNQIITVVGGVITAIGGFLNAVSQTSVVQATIQGIVNVVTNMLAGIKTVFDALGTAVNWLTDKLKTLNGSFDKKPVENHTKAVDDSSKKHEDLKKNVDASKTSLDNHTKTVSDHTTKTNALSKAVDEVTIKFKKVYPTAKDYGEGLAYVASKAAENSVNHEKLAKKIGEMKAAMEKMGDPVTNFNNDLDKLDKTIDSINKDVTTLGTTFNAQFPSAASVAKQNAEAVANAWKTLGLPDKTAIEAKVQEIKDAYETLKNSGIASQDELEKAWKNSQDAIAKLTKDGLDKQKTNYESFVTDVSSSISTFATDIGKSLFEGDTSWGEKGKKLLGDLAGVFTDKFISPVTKSLTDFVTNSLSKLLTGEGSLGSLSGLLDDIGNKFKNIFGAGSGAANAATGAAGAAGNAAGAAGNAGSAGSAVAGGAISSAINMVSGVVSAVTGVIGVFQMHGIGKDTGKIEENTRYTYINAEIIINKLNDWMPYLGGIQDLLYKMWHDGVLVLGADDKVIDLKWLEWITDYTLASRNHLSEISKNVANMVSAGPREITINVNGVSDPEEVANLVMEKLASAVAGG